MICSAVVVAFEDIVDAAMQACSVEIKSSENSTFGWQIAEMKWISLRFNTQTCLSSVLGSG